MLVLVAILLPFTCAGISPTLASSESDVYIAGQILGQIQPTPVRIQTVNPNDPYFPQQVSLRTLKIDQAWSLATGSPSTVAVIDTGINRNHQDLTNRLWVNSDEIPDNGMDDDHNGYVDDYLGYNFYNRNSDINDGHGHGTGIASIIAANTNNQLGLAGINWSARIMALKALDNLGGGDFWDVAEAIRYAVDNGASVINMSFGSNSDAAVLSEAVTYAISHGVSIVAAVGNNSSGEIFYPARYPQVIAVGSINAQNQLSAFSNYGSNMDIVAPGENIVMAGLGSQDYVDGAGSSFASAQVTGIVSLLLAKNPALSPSQIQHLMTTTAFPLGSGQSIFFGSGRADAWAALGQAGTQVASATVSSNPADYRMQWLGQSAYPTLAVGEQTTLWVELKNAGAATWVSQVQSATDMGQVRLGTDRPKDRASSLYHTSWLSSNRAATMSPAVVQPGETGRFTFTISASQPGNFREYFSVVAEGVTWLNDLGIYWDVTVTGTGGASGTVVSPVAYQANVEQINSPLVASPGEKVLLSVTLKNTGTATWLGSQSGSNTGVVKLGTALPHDRKSIFYLPTWLSPNRVLTGGFNVPPGSSITLAVEVFAPSQTGVYTETFQLVSEYITWFGPTFSWTINVI